MKAKVRAKKSPTKEDMQILTNGEKQISLKDELEKNGGSLNMEQMMKLAGK